VKLHIGCGQKYLPGYKHIDVMEAEHIDYVCDTRDLSVFTDGSADEIYACHILEHLEKKDVPVILDEWCRVLKEGGVIRISVPDFEAIVEEYVAHKNLVELQGLLYGGQTYDYNFHYVAFDFKNLEQLLEKTGFEGIERYDWQDFLPEKYDDFSRAYLPHLDFENGRLMSLNVVAYKKYVITS